MKEFISLREFCLLKDPTVKEPGRDTLAGRGMLWDNRGWAFGRDVVARYDIAKESWERFGDEGPPLGTKVVKIGEGAEWEMIGVFKDDPRFFEIKGSYIGVNNSRNYISNTIERTQWWAIIAPADCPDLDDRIGPRFKPWKRWENVTS